MAKKKVKQPAENNEAASPPIIAYKGFDKNLSCRGFKYEFGQTYTHDGEVKVCKSGFHACEHPLDVFSYYPPARSRFAEVELSGEIDRDGGDSKIASGSITIKAELHLPQLIERAIKWVFDRSKPEANPATGDQGAASATGDRGAASATGDRGAASATGDRGAASATGTRGAASATGTRGKVMGKEGNALFLVYRDDDWNIVHAWAGIVGQNGIKPETWYSLNADGQPVEAI